MVVLLLETLLFLLLVLLMSSRVLLISLLVVSLLLLLLCSSKKYLDAIQLKGTQGAKAWPVRRLVKLQLKGSVQSKSNCPLCQHGPYKD